MENKVTIKTGLPPIFDEIKKRFPEVDPTKTIFSFGDTIWKGFEKPLPDHLVAHELTHCERQGFNESGAKEWWKKYMTDDQFRLEEELIAYQAQYKNFCIKEKDRNRRARFASILASDLSGPVYGKIIEVNKAFKEITK